jgi:uroporphyrinogen-III synthase
MRLIVTRPAAQATGWVDGLRALGCEAQALPLIEIAPLADRGPVTAAWAELPAMALAMFVSANAVQHFFDARPAGRGWPPGVLAGSTGPGTSAALLAAGVPAADLVEPAPDAPRNDSEALWQQLAARPWAGRRALIVRGEEGRDWLADTLRAAGCAVDFLAAYRRRAPRPDADGLALLAAAQADPAGHLWLFSSSEAVGHLRGLVPTADWSASAALASHPRIAQAARDAGFGCVGTLPATPAELAGWLAAGRPIQSTAL